MLWNVTGQILLIVIAVIAFAATPVFRAFGDDQLNIWVTQFPYVWIAVMVAAALFGHVVTMRKLMAERRALPPRYQPSFDFSSVTSRSAISWFSATFGWYWQAYLSEVWGGIWLKNETFVSPAATRASTAALMWPWIVDSSPPFSSGAMMQTMYVCG